MYIVKQEQRDSKNRFSSRKLDVRTNVDISYPDIKKAGDLQTSNSRNNSESGKIIKTKKNKKSKQKGDVIDARLLYFNCFHSSLNISVDKYLSPVSGKRTTIVLL